MYQSFQGKTYRLMGNLVPFINLWSVTYLPAHTKIFRNFVIDCELAYVLFTNHSQKI